MADLPGRLYVLRHGQAEMSAVNDASRQLTRFGRRQVRAQAKRFSGELSALSHLYVSPYIRAQQTADELCSELGELFVGQRHEADWLTPETSLDRVLMELEPLMCRAPVLLVSHQPLVSYLIGCLSDTPAWQVNMDTASLAGLDVTLAAKGLAELKFLSPADVTQ